MIKFVVFGLLMVSHPVKIAPEPKAGIMVREMEKRLGPIQLDPIAVQYRRAQRPRTQS